MCCERGTCGEATTRALDTTFAGSSGLSRGTVAGWTGALRFTQPLHCGDRALTPAPDAAAVSNGEKPMSRLRRRHIFIPLAICLIVPAVTALGMGGATLGASSSATTDEFPIKASDDAYGYDRNPNSIRSQSVRYSLPRSPKRASRPSCLPMGAIGVAENGVAIFNALDALDRDAVAHEVQDNCGGHPQMSGLYHYHAIPACLTKGESKHRASGLVGYALDGYPIYGPRGGGGKLLSNDDLDACHGQTSKVRFEGRRQRIYHYNATLEYPYT